MNGKSSRYDKLESVLQDGCSEPHNLPLQYLRNITNNFSDERLLGEGGFGTVYKGLLQNGETIAVKKLHSSMPGVMDRHFENEANHLMRLKHPNVVLLVGWCFENEKTYTEYNGKYIWAEKPERLLCLEYMPKGNLRAYLSDELSGLGWDTRYKIIKGICYGLHYLHKEWQLDARIVHMDLKPANILLDNNMVPKIADFGLSRLFSEEKTWTCTISRDGSLGYMSPEYINKGLISTKSDIFSLGVIIIEIVTGQRDYPDETGTSSKEFIDMVLNNWSKRNRVENLLGHVSLEVEYQQIRKCIQIGLDCVKIDRFKRPTISQIIKTLDGLGSADFSNIKGSNSVASNGAAEEAVTAAAVGEDLMSPAAGGNAPPSLFFAAGDPLLDELQLQEQEQEQEQLAFLNDDGHQQLPLFTSEWWSPGAGPGDAYEATKVVFSRIQALDPDHAAKIIGFLLIQDHFETEMIRLAFGPEALLHAVMAKARKDLGLLPAPGSGPGKPTSDTSAAAAHSPFHLSRQNSGRCGGSGAGNAPSPLSVSSPSSWAPPPVFSRSNSNNPGSRQIYLTFPADTFREEDVSMLRSLANHARSLTRAPPPARHCSIYGPVHDVRIPYQQIKRMFGFVSFVYPETVKLILAKGNPHFICDARVLVKPYKEKGKVPDKYRKQQLQGDFSTGLDARDHFDLHQLGARMLQHLHSANEMLLRRKLEEQQQQQQAAELQLHLLQSRRLMGLHLLDL